MHIQSIDTKIVSSQIQTFEYTLQCQMLIITIDYNILRKKWERGFYYRH
jgi:hypothetical protein